MEFITVRSDRSPLILGRLTKTSGGWRFYPWVDGHRTSTRRWPTAREAIPVWVRRHGYKMEGDEGD